MEHLEDLIEGGANTPRPIRDLDPIEISILKEYAFPPILRKKNTFFFFCVGYLILIVIALALTTPSQMFVSDFANPVLVIDIVIFVSFTTSGFLGYMLTRKKYYLDLRSPVFATKGKLTAKGKNLYVRKIPITRRHFASNIPKTLSLEHDLYIEYSPHSKIIWRFREEKD